MAYALKDMLKIRAMREDKAGTELTGARRARTAAETVRDEKAQALETFESTKETRRDRVYEAVMGRVVSMDTLDQARAAVTRIDEEGMLLVEAKRQAQEELAKRTEAAEAAHIRFVAASKKKAKIDQHRLAWEEEDRKQQEMLADAEMDEFTGRKVIADDDDSLD